MPHRRGAERLRAYGQRMKQRLLVVGGDAAGMSAASQAKRMLADGLDVVVLERGHWTSYSACGIPYWVAGDVPNAAKLVARTPEQHRANGIDVRMLTEAVELDLSARVVVARHVETGAEQRIEFDQVLVATGARPVRPAVPGIDADGIYGVQTMDDGCRLLDALCAAGQPPRRAVVVGGGYIGIEMAEAMLRRGLAVTVVDLAPQPLPRLDPDMGQLVATAMEAMGIELVLSTPVDGFDRDSSGRVRAVLAGGREFGCDLVVLGLGVRPEGQLAADAGLPLGAAGAMRVEPTMAVPGHDGVWAAGDCVESFDRVLQRWLHVPLGTHANKQGRVAGINIAGGKATFPGVVGTAITKVCDLEAARTGIQEDEAQRAGLAYEVARIDTTTRAGYFPGTQPMTVKMLAETGSGRLLGAQIVGRDGSAKRIDTCALALWNEMTVDDLLNADLSYAPPFSSVWDPVQVAARSVLGKLADATGRSSV